MPLSMKSLNKIRSFIETWLDEMEDAIRERDDINEPSFGQPRRLTQNDLDSFFSPEHNVLREKMEKEHPYRWARMQRDVKWIKKEMKKLGLNPNDYRWWVG